MSTDTIRLAVISAIAISLVLADISSAMDNNFEIYKVDAINSFSNTYQYPQSYNNPVDRYQISSILNNVNNNENFPSRIEPQTSFQSSSTSCDDYWAYQTESGEVFGIITIPQPHYKQGIIQLTLSVAARLPSVSF